MTPRNAESFAARPLSAGAIALMLMLCLSWGFNQIAVKLALPDIPPLLQGTIRSIAALPVLLLIARFRSVNIFARDGTLRAGLLLGVLASRLLSFLVYQATPRDPLVLLGAVVAMTLVGLVATWIPASRALAVNPAELLREE